MELKKYFLNKQKFKNGREIRWGWGERKNSGSFQKIKQLARHDDFSYDYYAKWFPSFWAAIQKNVWRQRELWIYIRCVTQWFIIIQGCGDAGCSCFNIKINWDYFRIISYLYLLPSLKKRDIWSPLYLYIPWLRYTVYSFNKKHKRK